ncbi:MAG: Fe2+-dependent dioxygenase [Gammaproteobacteria bacterium]
MIVQLQDVLNGKQLGQLRELIAGSGFVDGKLSAGMEARAVKNNEELAADDRTVNSLNRIVMGSLIRHTTYQAAAFPLRVAAPFYARYTEGMAYGEHVDDPVMGTGDRYRSDIAITIFLSGPECYEGGELAISTSFGEQMVKLPAGDAILYPASNLHQVKEVTSGERLVAATWVQSMIRDPAKREVLFNLSRSRDHLLETAPNEKFTSLISQSYVNLLRMWSEL